MKYLKTLIKNATANPKTTATGIVILIAALGGIGTSFTADSTEAQSQIAIVTAILTALGAAIAGANSKD